MPKKRRERDRPKAALDAPYNPNDRFVLSYDSEVEEDDVVIPSGHSATSVAAGNTASRTAGHTESSTRINHQNHASSTIDRPDHTPSMREGEAEEEPKESALVDGEEEDREEVAADSQDDSEQFDDGDEAADESIESGHGNNRKPTAYEEIGMKPMFLPDMAKSNNLDDEDDYDSETDEAMAYLASVQNERQAIPALLTAHSYADVRFNGLSAGHQGAFADGVYASKPPDTPAEPDPQEEYINAITTGFRQVREQLQQPPTEDEMIYAQDTVFIDEVPSDNRKFLDCVYFVRDTPPALLQIKGMSAETAWDLLQLVIERFFLKGDRQISQNIGWWIYMLLARLPDKHALSDDQIEGLRTLAKRIVHVRETVCKPGHHEASDQSVEKHTQTTVDTVLIIIGDFYNQRDLLEFRVWPPI